MVESQETAGPADGSRQEHVVAFIDLGTNSVRLKIVSVQPDHAYGVITLQREPIRLGEREFAVGRLQPEAMDRAVLVCRSFVELARSYDAEEIVAVATSATREASNRAEFVRRLRHEAGVDVHVISGLEEARLVYLGVLSCAEVGDRTALAIDIGGGSTEVAVGTGERHLFLDSLSLGALRVTDAILREHGDGPVCADLWRETQHRVKLKSTRVVQDLRRFRIDVAYGTSGTIRNLAAAAARHLHDTSPERVQSLTRGDLRKLAKLLRSLNVEERAQVPGINPQRADIIVAGAAILESLMTDLELKEIVAVAECGLREGLVVDYLRDTGQAGLVEGLSVRERSVLHLGRSCKFDERHARRVRDLSLQLFDSGRESGLLGLGPRERDLLGHAALLHDVGSFLSYRDHHLHSAYVVRSADLLGFGQDEIEMIALTARFHRKGLPGARNAELEGLRSRDRASVRVMSLLLRLAERLDRSRAGTVRRAGLTAGDDGAAVLTLEAAGECNLELWGIAQRQEAMERALGRPLRVSCEAAEPDRSGGD